jgi:hypothetical protein
MPLLISYSNCQRTLNSSELPFSGKAWRRLIPPRSPLLLIRKSDAKQSAVDITSETQTRPFHAASDCLKQKLSKRGSSTINCCISTHLQRLVRSRDRTRSTMLYILPCKKPLNSQGSGEKYTIRANDQLSSVFYIDCWIRRQKETRCITGIIH